MCSPTIDVPAVRSSLSKMSPSNHPYNLIKCYAAIKEVEKIMSVSSWKYPHAAFRHTENLERISKKLDSAWTEDYFHSVSYRDDFQMIGKRDDTGEVVQRKPSDLLLVPVDHHIFAVQRQIGIL